MRTEIFCFVYNRTDLLPRQLACFRRYFKGEYNLNVVCDYRDDRYVNTFADICIDYDILKQVYEYPEIISKSLDKFKFRESVNSLIELSRLGNKYLAEKEPWKLIKEGKNQRVNEIMYISLQTCAMIAILSEPFLPNASKKLISILNLKKVKWNDIDKSNALLTSNNKINKPELIFRKIEDEEIENQLKKLKGN